MKLHDVANKIGYPDKWRDYSCVDIKRGDFCGNVERGQIVRGSQRQLAKIGKPVDRGEWEMTPPTVNAYYDPQMNDINFPAGVLQPPLFDPKMDDAPNYGNTGGTIGHELTHGFDDEGRQFDAQGQSERLVDQGGCQGIQKARAMRGRSIRASTPWSTRSRSTAKLTLGEDVADLGGLVIGWMAWKAETADRQLCRSSTASRRSSASSSAIAQWACEHERPEVARLHALTNPHSPERTASTAWS